MITTNSERVTTRINPQVKATLTTAASLTGSTINQFLVNAALEKAEKIIENNNVIKLSQQDAKVFFAAMDNHPKANKKLTRAFAHYKNSL